MGGLLTNTFRLKVEKKLSLGDFLADDFNIKTADSYSYVRLTITYKYIQKYSFEMKITSSNEFNISFSPGSILNSESYQGIDESSYLNKISNWLDNINRELNNSPLTRKLTEHEDILKSMQNKISSLENHDILFSNEEKNDYNNRLDELEALFMKKIEESNANQDKFKSQIKKMQNDINVLKSQLNVFTKKNWVLSFSTRLYNWYKTNPLLTRQIVGFTRELLPEEARDFISNDALDQLLLPPENNEKK